MGQANKITLREFNTNDQNQIYDNLETNIKVNINEIEEQKIHLQTEYKADCEQIQILETKIRQISETTDISVQQLNEYYNSFLDLQGQEQKYLNCLSIHEKIQQIDFKLQKYKQQYKIEEIDQLQQNLNEINNQSGELELRLQQIQSYKIYQQQLIQKTKELEEINSTIILLHKCGRESHKCDQICECCNNEQIYCKYLAGHNHTAHLCENNDHFCKQKCRILDCEKQCQHYFQHEEILKHDCKEQHPCKFKCEYNGCARNCSISAGDPHNDHKCDVTQCTHQCYFQQNSCSEDKKCHNKCSYLHTQNHDIHICSSQKHQCNHQCELPGVCKIETYSEIDKCIKSEDGISTFNYKFIVQNDKKIQCQIMIDAFKIKHEGQHICNQVSHTCDQRCPECNAFCNETFNHKDGKHKPHLHRNKDIHRFTALVGEENEESILQNEDQSIVMVKVGQSCEPETCSKNCFRRSRAHFHLLECDNKKSNCQKLNKKYQKNVAHHQTKKYIGSDKIFDEVLCEYYWDYLGWEIPVDKTQRNKISQCNYYCNICESKEPIFCSQQAWHDNTDDYFSHNFACAELHKNIEGVDVQFVIDTTGSMQSYIDLVKKTIKNLIEASKKVMQHDSKSILFSIISYKDHLDVLNKDSVCKSIDFNTHEKAITFLNQLVTDQGGDTPEAMLDGLHEASNQKWRQDSKKFLFLIADSPPHGLQYHNMDDDFPHGCPCGLKENDVLQKLKDKNIKVIFYMLNDSVNQTFQSFRRTLPNIEDVRKIDDEYFMKKIQKLVCQQLKIREVTIKKQ